MSVPFRFQRLSWYSMLLEVVGSHRSKDSGNVTQIAEEWRMLPEKAPSGRLISPVYI